MHYTETTIDTSKPMKVFKLIEKITSSGAKTDIYITMSYEQYTAPVEQFASNVQILMNKFSPSKNYIVSYGLDGKMTISNTDTDYKTFSLAFLPPPGVLLSLYKELGFGLVTTYDFSNSFTSDNRIDKSQIMSKNEKSVLIEAGVYTFNGFLAMLQNKMNKDGLRYKVYLFDGKIKIEYIQADINRTTILI